jgi:DNA polymerase I-like protein with 3'-5' exonuclease and polymerase domains
MPDDFDGFFGFEPQQVKKAKVKKTSENPILYIDDYPNLNVLVADVFSEWQLKHISAFFHQSGAKINLVYCFPFEADARKNILRLSQYFYENVRSDLKDYFIPNVPIISIGQAIYATTFDTDIQVQGFYDSVFNNTYFYSPFVNNRIYPIDTIFKICGFGQPDKKTGESIYYFDRWETYFAKKQIERALKVGDCSLSRKKSIEHIIVESPNEWLHERSISVPEDELWVAIDSETGGFDKLSDPIGDITLSFDGWTAYYLAWEKINPWYFYDFIKSHKIIGTNFKFDFLFFMFHGVEKDIQISWDTMTAGHLLNEMRSNSLKAHSFWYTNYGGYDLELEKYKWKYPGLKNYLQIPDSIRIPYACMDAAMTYQVWRAQVQDMRKEPDLWDYYHKYVLPMLQVTLKMEYKGFDIDWDKVVEVGGYIQKNIKKALADVRSAFKNPDLNPNRKQELGKFIESLGWTCISRTKAGGYRVSKKEFAEWEKMGHPEVKTLNEYSKWVIVWNTFIGADSNYEDNDIEYDEDGVEVDFDDTELNEDDFFTSKSDKIFHHDATGLWQYKAVDNKVHTTFHAFMTKSHRHRSSSPNLQNIPKHNYEVSQIVRQCYKSPDVVPCKPHEATKIFLFDCRKGMTIHLISDTVEIGIKDRIQVLAKELINYTPRYYGYRVEYYKDAVLGDYYILEVDGTNLQAKIAASMSHDTNLCQLFLNGGDFHTNNAYHILAKYQLFDECTVKFTDGSVEIKMEYNNCKVKRNEREIHAYYNEFQNGDILPNGRVVEAISKVSKQISYEEYCKNAKKGKCKDLRQIAKMIGLSFIFGAGASNLARGTLRMAWTPKRCQEFIKERKLEDLLNQTIQRNKSLIGDNLYYYVVSSFFRAEFFKLYPELEQWIAECARDTSVVGYRRSPWGSRRLLPQLTYQGKHSDGGIIKNLSNISVNSPVQDYETVVMATVMISTDTVFEELGYISYMPGMVHDSAVTIVYEDELDSVLNIELSAFEFKHPATYGIPYGGECNVADFSKGEFWGFGKREVEFKEVKDIVPIRKRYKIR